MSYLTTTINFLPRNSACIPCGPLSPHLSSQGLEDGSPIRDGGNSCIGPIILLPTLFPLVPYARSHTLLTPPPSCVHFFFCRIIHPDNSTHCFPQHTSFSCRDIINPFSPIRDTFPNFPSTFISSTPTAGEFPTAHIFVFRMRTSS